MSKLEWQQHWQQVGPHDTKTCSECAKRRKTKRANDNRKARDSALRSLGLTKVRGNLGGTYWE